MGLKVVKLVAENVKGLKAVEIVPDENFQIIAGANGQGKSSVLDVIWLALAGGAASKSVARPVRDGADKALASVDMGDFVVTRKWTSNEKSTLQVVSKEGAKFSSPQKMLDELIGKLSFDPLAFSNLDTKAQLKTLLELAEIDPTPIELEKKSLFEERTIANREVKNLKAQLDAFPEVIYKDVPDEELQMSDILAEMNAAQEILKKNETNRKRLSEAHQEFLSKRQEHQLVDVKIKQLEEELAKLRNYQQTVSGEMKVLSEKGSILASEVNKQIDPDLSVFNEKINEVDEINKKVREKQQRNKLLAEWKHKVTVSDSYTLKLSDLEFRKQAMISAAKFPIEGLSFDDSGVLYNGVPFKQCSAAERLKVSIAMAMALNPNIRVIRILDGSLLDTHNMKIIEDMAREKDYQVWIEVVDESGKVGITIENGEVKA